ncbi:MAG: exodeoxyribonuclease VII large subunit [Caldiserica bacterium]|nr:exodeoxyribonuclease VII large subunit [Caldisericota bacterium]
MSGRKVYEKEGVLHIEFDYDKRLVDLVRGLPERRWNRASRTWTVPARYVVAVVDLLREEGFSFDEATLRLYEEERARDSAGLTVSQLNLQVRNALQAAFPGPVWVVGEILGFGKNAHKEVVDFLLAERSDDGSIVAEVTAVLFPEARAFIEGKLARAGNPFRLEDEIVVRMLVQVDLKVDWGQYRVIVQDLDIDYTLGEVARRKEEILRKLAREGLLERNRSLAFPALPLRVGLITSLGSDAENDVLKTLRESGFAFRVTVHGARVQGPYTEASVLNALDWFRERVHEFDVILICRGGGSRTDLAWFDSEALGRAVATFPIPVVIGIGHEQDFSVLDYVGWRAKTPTAAAQLLVQRVRETMQGLEDSLGRVLQRAEAQLSEARQRQGERTRRLLQAVGNALRVAERDLARLSRALPRAVGVALGGQRSHLAGVQARLLRATARGLGDSRGRLAELSRRIAPLATALVAREREHLAAREKRLRALDPRRVVERGYAILRLPGRGVVVDPAQAPAGTRLVAEVREGLLRLLSEGGERRGGGGTG